MHRDNVLIALGPLLALTVGGLLLGQGFDSALAATAGVSVWVILWWVGEPVPIPVTSLLPMGLFPLLGVMSGKQVALAYGSPLILLLLGGFLLSKAMESTGAHRKVALLMVSAVGGNSARRLVFGFMLASALLSMWISNTAVTLMLLPVALAVLERARSPELAVPLLLGLAYSASIGGIGTPIGTPPNLVFMQVYTETTQTELSFFEWMTYGVPVVVCLLPLVAWWITRKLGGVSGVELGERERWTTAQGNVMIIFALTALAWMTRKAPFGGWSTWFDVPTANDAAVAFVAVVLLFTVPNGKDKRLLDWQTAVNVPWGVLLLFAGSMTLASAFKISGLSAEIAALPIGIEQLPLLLMMFLLAIAVSFLTETTSNTASTTLLMPVLAAAALGAGLDPMLLMLPAAISASCAFMLPVATAPNSVVYGSGHITTQQMAREGFALNWIGALVVTLVCYLRMGHL